MPYKSLTVFAYKETLYQTFFEQSDVRFYVENGRFAFLSPLGGRGNVRC